MMLVPILVFAGGLAADPGEGGPSTIVGGMDAAACQWPSAVAMLEDDATPSMCTGTLVHPSLVMTAAHCILEERPIVAVGFGEYSEGAGVPEREVEVVDCVQHPDYLGQGGWPDVGWCSLAQPVLDVPIVPLMTACETGSLHAGALVTIVGFGSDFAVLDDEGNPVASGIGTKRHAQQLVHGLSLPDAYVDVYWTSGSQAACFGDSGGPALVQLGDGTWRVFGVAAHLFDPGGLPPPQEPGNVCGTGATYLWASAEIAWIEASSGLDVTPCWDGDVWIGGPGCGPWPEAPHVGGGDWSMGCAGPIVDAQAPECADVPPPPPPPDDTGGESTSDAGSSDDGDDFADTGVVDDGTVPPVPMPVPPLPSTTDDGGDETTTGSSTGEGSGSGTDTDTEGQAGQDRLADRGCACATDRRGTGALAWLCVAALALRRRRRRAFAAPPC